MTARSNHRRKVQQVLAEHNLMPFELMDDNASVISRTQSLRLKPSESIKMSSRKRSGGLELRKDIPSLNNDDQNNSSITHEKNVKKNDRIQSEKSTFNSKPNYRWLFEPDMLKGKIYQESSMEDWLRTVFSRKTVKFKRYDLLMMLLSYYRPMPIVNSYSTNDLSMLDLRRSSTTLINGYTPTNLSGTASPVSGSTQNLRIIALQQQQQLKTHVMMQRRRLSGSMSSLDTAAALLAPLPSNNMNNKSYEIDDDNYPLDLPTNLMRQLTKSTNYINQSQLIPNHSHIAKRSVNKQSLLPTKPGKIKYEIHRRK